MKKCVNCGKTGEGRICKRCIAKGANNIGKVARGAGKYVGMFAAVVIGAIITDKFKNGDRS